MIIKCKEHYDKVVEYAKSIGEKPCSDVLKN